MTPASFAKRNARLLSLIAREERRLALARNARLGVALAFVSGLAVCAAFPRLRAELWLTVAFAAGFPPLVARTARLTEWLRKLRALAAHFERARDRALGDLHGPASEEFAYADDRERAAARDLHVVGPRSLMALIDETVTAEGRAQLLRSLLARPVSADCARERQSRVRALSALRWPILRAIAATDRGDLRVSSHELRRLVADPLAPPRAAAQAIFACAAWAAAATAVVAGGAGRIPPGWAALAIAGFAALSHGLLQRWGPAFLKSEGVSAHANKLNLFWTELESIARRAPARALLPELAERPIASALRAFDRAAALASLETHPIFFLFVNALLPWNVVANARLENARRLIAERAPKVIDETQRFEAWMSLALYAAEHGGAWPEFVDEPALDCEDLAHPLLPPDRAVTNSICLMGDERAALLTGSNMSGKSTFLRALGASQILACAGAPVRARRYRCGPLTVETCIQIEDSIGDGVSYFYAEVLRLRDILNDARGPVSAPTLILIDEIFRGTNNRERLIGSRALISALAAAPNALTVVSSHDLELATLECVTNWHFRDEARAGRLAFDYRLRPGPCPTTNALRIMQAEGLPVNPPD